ncbi:MAG: SMI1/KNR4 family protein [Gammaproteobacteria bacterium]
MDKLLTLLQRRGWKIERKPQLTPLFPEDFDFPYSSLPQSLIEFLDRFNVFQNSEKNIWFLTGKDYYHEDTDGFRWNEYKFMELDESESPEEAAEIEHFWLSHFPFALAVHSGDDYLAVNTHGLEAGAIVHGYAPFWQEPSIIAASFEEFLQKYLEAAESNDPPYPYSLFL